MDFSRADRSAGGNSAPERAKRVSAGAAFMPALRELSVRLRSLRLRCELRYSVSRISDMIAPSGRRTMRNASLHVSGWVRRQSALPPTVSLIADPKAPQPPAGGRVGQADPAACRGWSIARGVMGAVQRMRLMWRSLCGPGRRSGPPNASIATARGAWHGHGRTHAVACRAARSIRPASLDSS